MPRVQATVDLLSLNPHLHRFPGSSTHEEEHFRHPCHLLQPPLLGHFGLSYMCGPAADALKMLLSHSPLQGPWGPARCGLLTMAMAAAARHRPRGGWGVAGGP